MASASAGVYNASTLFASWSADPSITVNGTAYTFSSVHVTAVGNSAGTSYYDQTSSSQASTVNTIDASAEPGPIAQVLVTIVATYTASGYANQPVTLLADLVLITGPYAPTLTDPNQQTVDRGMAFTTDAMFASPQPDDHPTAYDCRWSTDHGSSWSNLGKTILGSGDVTQTLAVWGANEFTDGTTVELQVMWWGRSGATGPWSASQYVTFRATPATPVITTPGVDDLPVDYSTLVALQDVAGRESFQLRRMTDPGTIGDMEARFTTIGEFAAAFPTIGAWEGADAIWDSGQVPANGSASIDVAFPNPGRYEVLQARQQIGGLWSDWASRRVYPSYAVPSAPVLTVAADGTSIVIQVVNPTPGAGQLKADHNVIAARSFGADTPEWQRSNVAVGAAVVFATPAHDVEYEFIGTAVGVPGSGPSATAGWEG